MNVGKWNFETKEYEPYELPEGASSFETDMDKVIECASCGRKMTFGYGYTSRTIHALPSGFGYSVCEKCYEDEWRAERRNRWTRL